MTALVAERSSSRLPSLGMTMSARFTLSASGSWAPMRSRACSSLRPSRLTMRRTCSSSVVDTTMTLEHTCSRCLDSYSVGASMTTMGVPLQKHQATCLAISLKMAGPVMAVSLRRSAASLNTMSPSFCRSSPEPSSLATPLPKALMIARNAGRPGSTTSRAITSQSTTAMPLSRSSRVTVDLPQAMPPVRPSTRVIAPDPSLQQRARCQGSLLLRVP
mmetsp:Transcript_13219/g.42119  ORF Transcript_13219/g.42119 Transcript_13219/m.42119 type:complete len:217 (-) Transcript_13219:277-927(-)